MTRPDQFNRDYFENGIAAGVSCYTNYRWLPAMTVPMARAIAEHVGFDRDSLILDYGCAKGFLVKAFRMLGYQAFGVDVSEYAIAQADEFTRPFVQCIEPGQHTPGKWDVVIAKDVLEHLSEDEIRQALRSFRRTTSRLFVVVPLGDGQRFVIPEMENDVTHKTRQPLEWWCREIHEAGFEQACGCYAVDGVKDKWTAGWPEGNGFIIGSRF